MNTGVSMVPCGVCRSPTRARVSLHPACTSKVICAKPDSTVRNVTTFTEAREVHHTFQENPIMKVPILLFATFGILCAQAPNPTQQGATSNNGQPMPIFRVTV